MEAELLSKLKAGHVTDFWTWLSKQPTKPLNKIFITGQVALSNYRPSCDVPHLFALVHLLTESGTSAEEEENVKCIFKKYIQAGCNINQTTDTLPSTKRSRKGFTPLLLAIEQRKCLVTKVLIELGADVNISDFVGYSPLYWVALVASNVEMMKCLLDNGAEIVNDGHGDVRPLLHVAVDEGRVVIVDYLLGIGLNVNTPSVYAVLQEQYWCACDTKSRYDCGVLNQYRRDLAITPLGRAVRMKKLDVLSVLLRHPDSIVSLDDLHYCILEGDSQMANMIMPKVEKKLLKCDKVQGTDILILHQLGSRAFDFECNETKQLIQTYVEHGFDINSTSTIKEDLSFIESTLLLSAIKNNPMNFELMHFLVTLGADPFIKIGPKSAFNIATSRNDIKMAEVFMNARMDISNRMKEFEDIFQMRVNDKMSQLNYIKTFVPNVQLDCKHLFKSTESGNEFLVEFILQMMPKDSSLFMRQNYSKLIGNLETEEEMPTLLENFVEKSLGNWETIEYVCLPSVMQVVRGFLTRGYDLYQNQTKPLTSTIVNATLYLPSSQHDDALILFKELLSFPKINWAPKPSRAYPLPINGVIQKLSVCPLAVRLGQQNNLALFRETGDDDQDLHFDDEYSPIYPRMYSSRCIEPESTGVVILESLLDNGVYADHINLTNLLKCHPCLIQYLQVLKKLWWAGGEMDFYEIENLFDDAVLQLIGKEELVLNFREWMKIGKQKNCTLQRFVGICIRKSMKYHNMDNLMCHVLPTRAIKELMTSPD